MKLAALPKTLTVLRLFNSMGEVVEPQLERNLAAGTIGT